MKRRVPPPMLSPARASAVEQAATVGASSPAVVAPPMVPPARASAVEPAATVAASAPVVVASSPAVVASAPPMVSPARASAVEQAVTVGASAPVVVAPSPAVVASSPTVVTSSPAVDASAPPIVSPARASAVHQAVTFASPPVVVAPPMVPPARASAVEPAATVVASAPVVAASSPVVTSAPRVSLPAPPVVAAPSRRARRRRAPLVAVVAAAALSAACPAEKRGVSRDALRTVLEDRPRPAEPAPPTLEEIQALRVPAIGAPPADLATRRPTTALERARLAVALKGDVAAAEKEWATAPDDVELLAHRCLVEEALRRYAPLVEACARFVDRAPADPRAPLAILVLERAASATGAARAAILAKATTWIDGCARARGPDRGCADLAWIAGQALRDAAAQRKDEQLAREGVRRAGFAVKATVIGPFDGEPRRVLDDAAAGAQPALQPLRGSTRTSGAWDGRFAPATRGEDGVYRLIVAGQGRGGPATLYATGAVDMRVAIDGVPVVERRPRERPEPRATRVGVELAPGAHTIEVLAASVGRGDGVSIALLSADGAPALQWGPPSQPAPKGRGRAKLAAPIPGAVEGVPLVAEGDPLAAVDRLQWRHVLARSGLLGVADDEARVVSRRLLERAGWAPPALVVAAQSVGDDPTVPDRLSSSAARPLWERLAQTWPDHPVARVTHARALREERPDEALDAYRALVAARPDYPFGWRDLVGVALERGAIDEAVRAADALLAVEKSPENVDAALPALRRAGRIAEAERLERARVREELALYGDGVARALLSAGRTEDALRELARVVDAEPGHVATELLWDLLELRDPKAAAARVAQHLQSFPNDVAAHRRKARLALLLEGPDAARKATLAALERFGGDEDLRGLGEELGVQPAWVERFAAGDRAIAARRARAQEAFPGHPVVFLVDHVERHVYEDESSTVVRHWIAELKTKDVLDRFGEISLGRDERLLRLRVVKPDGSVLEPEHHRDVDDVSLTGLAPGDLVELLTTSASQGPLLEGTSFETRVLDGAAPALERQYVLTAPPPFVAQRRVELVGANGAAAVQPERVVVDGRERLRWTWRATDVEAVLDEPMQPSRDETGRLVGFSYGLDDEAWAYLRGRPVLLAARPDPWLADAALRVAGQGTARERFRRLFSFVVRRVEEAGRPDDAVEALATGRGARTPLLYAMARAAGLDVDLVAVEPPNAPPAAIPLPSRFRRVGVRAKLPDADAWAFVDDGLAVLDALPPRMQGARALVLDDEARGARAIPLPDTAIAQDAPGVKLDLEAKGRALVGAARVHVPAAAAEATRRGVRGSTQEQLQAWVERALGDSFPGVQVENVRAEGLKDAGTPLEIRADVVVPLPETAGEPARFEHLFAQGAAAQLGLFTPIATYLRVADRKLPLDVPAEAEVLEARIRLPKGAAFTEAPGRLSVEAGPFRLEQRVEVEDGTLAWTRTLESKQARVSARDWPALRARLTQLAARTDARLSFVVPKG